MAGTRVRALAALGRPNEGVALARARVDEHPTAARWVLLADAYERAGKLDAGIASADVALGLDAKEASGYRSRGILRAELGDFAGCAEDLARFEALGQPTEADHGLQSLCEKKAVAPDGGGDSPE